jgi:hypothetical protein
MKKNIPLNCTVYKHRNKTYLSIPKGFKVVKVVDVDGTKTGILKKRNTLVEILFIAWITILCCIMYYVYNCDKQVIQIPNSVYVTGNYLNVDINNPETNPYDVYITIKSPDGITLYESGVPRGGSIGAIEINTGYPAYIIEYKIKWNNLIDLSKQYRISNQDYREE